MWGWRFSPRFIPINTMGCQTQSLKRHLPASDLRKVLARKRFDTTSQFYEGSGKFECRRHRNDTENVRFRHGNMRFPRRIRHRGQVLATIYGKSKSYPAYRLAWRVAGERRMERCQSYSEAKRRADAAASGKQRAMNH